MMKGVREDARRMAVDGKPSLGVLLGIIIFDGMRWLINALPGLRDWLADWRLERRNRKAIRRLWRAYGRKPARPVKQTWALWYGGGRGEKYKSRKRPK